MSQATVALSRAHPGRPEELGMEPCQGWGALASAGTTTPMHRAPASFLCPFALVWGDQPPRWASS